MENQVKEVKQVNKTEVKYNTVQELNDKIVNYRLIIGGFMLYLMSGNEKSVAICLLLIVAFLFFNRKL